MLESTGPSEGPATWSQYQRIHLDLGFLSNSTNIFTNAEIAMLTLSKAQICLPLSVAASSLSQTFLCMALSHTPSTFFLKCLNPNI